MIRAVFFKEGGRLSGFSLSGHAGCGYSGSDVVCAAVSSAAQLVCNAVTDHFDGEAVVRVLENELELTLKSSCGEASRKLIEAFCEHLGFISEEYPDSIEISRRSR